MAQKAMRAMLSTLLEQVGERVQLRSLLLKEEHEEMRPRVRIGGKMYVLGLVDEKPMLVHETTREFLNPDLVGEEVTEIIWKLQ